MNKNYFVIKKKKSFIYDSYFLPIFLNVQFDFTVGRRRGRREEDLLNLPLMNATFIYCCFTALPIINRY